MMTNSLTFLNKNLNIHQILDDIYKYQTSISNLRAITHSNSHHQFHQYRTDIKDH